MPRIPQYSNQVDVNPSEMQIAARRLDILGDQKAAALDRGVHGLQQGVARVEQQAEANEASGVSAALSKAQMDATSDLEVAKQSGQTADPDFVQKFMAKHTGDALDNIGSGLLTRGAQQYYQRASQELKQGIFKQVVAEHAASSGENAVASYQQSITALANNVSVDPTSTATTLALTDTLMAGSHIPDTVRAQLAKQAKTTIADSGAERYVSAVEGNPYSTQDNIEQVRTILNSDTFKNNVSPTKYASLMARLDTAKKTRMTAQSSIINSQMPAVLEQVEKFGDNGNAQKMIDNYVGSTPEATAAWKEEQSEKLEAAQAVFTQRRAMENMSGPEMDQYILNLRDAAGKAGPADARAAVKSYDAAMSYKAQRDTEFARDPAGYAVKNNETIGQLFTKYQNSKDPQDFQIYAQYTLALQQHMEPTSPGNLVTPQMKQEWSGLAQQITTRGAPAAQEAMAQGAKQYGIYWPRVAQELMNDKILTGPQFAAATMYGKPNAYGVATDVLIASTTPWKDLVANGQTHQVTETEAVQAAATALQPFRATLRNVANGQQLAGAYQDALARTLLYRGTADSSDASDIAGKMIADQYTMTGSTRIPNWMNLDTGKVQRGIEHGLDGVDLNGVVVPESASGLGPNDQKQNYLSALKSTGQWYTNGDDSGVTLYDAANHNVLVQKGGKYVPVTLTWKQLQDIGEKNLNPLDRVGRFLSARPQ